MKCDELKTYHVPAEIAGGVVLAKAFDYYKKKPVDAAIAELKQKLHDLCAQSMDVSGKTIDKVSELMAENERLKKEISDIIDGFCDSTHTHIEELRVAKRALWLDKAARANAEWGHWATIWFCDTGAILNINKSSVSQDPYRCTITRNAAEWRNLWAEVERKCRAKAEEYK
ncbi:MAG: hypothetical protein J6P62_05520 [Bacteroidales bacterium]|nr:hypothetical protein [Bacteroidales bacterium]